MLNCSFSIKYEIKQKFPSSNSCFELLIFLKKYYLLQLMELFEKSCINLYNDRGLFEKIPSHEYEFIF